MAFTRPRSSPAGPMKARFPRLPLPLLERRNENIEDSSFQASIHCGKLLASQDFARPFTPPDQLLQSSKKSRRSGGMADAPDSKSGPRKWVWVQVPPSAVRPFGCSPFLIRLPRVAGNQDFLGWDEL